MRLLIASTWSPYPPDNGSRLRAWHLLRALSREHTLHLVAGWQDDSPASVPPELAALCASVDPIPWRWHQPGGTGAVGGLKALLSTTPRSILETPNAPFTDALAARLADGPDLLLGMELGVDPHLPPLPESLPCVLDQVEVSGMESAYTSATGWKERAARGLTLAKGVRHWRRRLRRYTALTAVSEPEAEAVRRVVGDGGPPTLVVPNGVAVSQYPPPAAEPVSGCMIYNGALSYGPNRDAVLWFVEAVLPRIAQAVPDAHLVVTGRADGAPDGLKAHPRVRLTGFLDDLRPTLAQAALAVVPLRSGGGTRLKILEAWAAGVPVVATRVGAAGLDARDGAELLLADTPDALADACIALLGDSSARQSLARAGRALAETRYDWDAIGADLSRRLTELVRTSG